MRKFTKQQVDFICYEIGEWDVQWKNQLVDYDAKTHRLGYAKELLKERICGKEYKDLEDEYDPNSNISKKPWKTEPDFLEFIELREYVVEDDVFKDTTSNVETEFEDSEFDF